MKIWQRILLFVAVYICALVLPWWLTTMLLVALTIFVPTYVEVVFFGFLLDTLYSNQHVGLIGATIFLILVILVKSRVRM
jgi:hypothetical protein